MGSEGYEIRDKYGQIRSAGRGAVPGRRVLSGAQAIIFRKYINSTI